VPVLRFSLHHRGCLAKFNIGYNEEIKISWETIQLYTYTQIKVKQQCFHCCSTFHSHSKVFNNEHVSYPKMSGKMAPNLKLNGIPWYVNAIVLGMKNFRFCFCCQWKVSDEYIFAVGFFKWWIGICRQSEIPSYITRRNILINVVTVRSSIMSMSHTLKWVEKWLLIWNWMVFFTSANKRKIWTSLLCLT
jgi:hypothetical protein